MRGLLFGRATRSFFGGSLVACGGTDPPTPASPGKTIRAKNFLISLNPCQRTWSLPKERLHTIFGYALGGKLPSISHNFTARVASLNIPRNPHPPACKLEKYITVAEPCDDEPGAVAVSSSLPAKKAAAPSLPVVPFELLPSMAANMIHYTGPIFLPRKCNRQKTWSICAIVSEIVECSNPAAIIFFRKPKGPPFFGESQNLSRFWPLFLRGLLFFRTSAPELEAAPPARTASFFR